MRRLLPAIRVASRRTGAAKLEAWRAEGWAVVDVTSRSSDGLGVRLSPFFPHGGIPVPGQEGKHSESVEGVWQGLKLIRGVGVDEAKFTILDMRNLKRKGAIQGHRWGRDGVLGYIEARKRIYVPTYRWVLENRVDARPLLAHGKLVLLDYATNEDVSDPSRPLSHAAVLREWLLERAGAGP